MVACVGSAGVGYVCSVLIGRSSSRRHHLLVFAYRRVSHLLQLPRWTWKLLSSRCVSVYPPLTVSYGEFQQRLRLSESLLACAEWYFRRWILVQSLHSFLSSQVVLSLVMLLQVFRVPSCTVSEISLYFISFSTLSLENFISALEMTFLLFVERDAYGVSVASRVIKAFFSSFDGTFRFPPILVTRHSFDFLARVAPHLPLQFLSYHRSKRLLCQPVLMYPFGSQLLHGMW